MLEAYKRIQCQSPKKSLSGFLGLFFVRDTSRSFHKHIGIVYHKNSFQFPMPSKCKLNQHAVEGLIQYFELHPYCINNCVVGICGLPEIFGNYCKSCFSNETYCSNIKSCNNDLTDTEKKNMLTQIGIRGLDILFKKIIVRQ